MIEPDYNQDNIKLFNADCMDLMKQYPDNYFDISIVDPPYFSGPEKKGYYAGKNNKTFCKKYTEIESWELPTKEYFIELFRVSKNQIIWGCNYFDFDLRGARIVWLKASKPGTFSQCELAYHSFYERRIDFVDILWNGMWQHDMKNKENRIHPTQKPIKLYSWIYSKYAKPGQKILDTHLGSGSNAISAHYSKMGEFVGCELDADYFKASVKRIYSETRQLDLF